MSVLVYIQHFDGKLKKQNFEVASFAANIAASSQSKAIALILGTIDNSEIERLKSYGITKTIHVDGELFNTRINKIFTQVIEQVAVKENVNVIIFPDNNTGKAIAPRLSVRLRAGFVSGVVSLPLTYEPFVIAKRVFSGKAFATIKIKTQIKILSLAINSYGLHENLVNFEIEKFIPQVSFDTVPIKIVDRKVTQALISLADADIVVSGGRGMRGPENWKPLEDLAKELGAATACSRPVSDDGWRSHEEHVGQTGKIIAPNLYIAVGISGATQHVAGISRSKCLVAINTDNDAPIFEVANYGILGDAQKVLPKLTEAFKKFKGE
jgi:electron transfer flavoprotein alpha subunit